ncbi:hypothetical protein [Caulobacter phage KcrB]|nr:hypothetical protein RW_GP056 [Caulobacter phage RW]WCA46360.1 hypothetical protein [Caulobacter phage KcrB]WCD56295.1 hypothetical protein [Caulobacter phage RLK]WNV48087.1 hypothetical protein GB2A_gp055 [Caulobacter phage GB2A]
MIGHNAFAGDALKAFVERIERLEAEKAEIAEGVKQVKAEAKATGFDPKTIAAIVRLRSKDPHKVKEAKAIMELYASALGCEDLV